ncbi:LamG domain-containing protein [Saccharicrinis sp. 156]|uniref:LamG domain-containing protein n=1 Tax=Saccharicrinis sp. 156 TaxID=3417574 RepID=UPI003D335D6D
MKTYFKLIMFALAILVLNACEQDYIDGITKVDPGADETAPQVTIVYPAEGTSIKVYEAITSINIEFVVTDDIEIKDIKIILDGTEIAAFSSFMDYRKAIEEYTYDQLATGVHVLTVTATDLEGKSTSASVNFEKEPPYVPMFDGEIFYMPFDNDYMELVNVAPATEVGTPSFAGESLLGTNAYMGATDSYLTYPIGQALGNGFTAGFWYKVNGTPGKAGILVVGDDADDRKQGFRLFREGNGVEQQIKLNVGTGTGEIWNNGGFIDVAEGEWIHIAFSISETKNTIFFNGVEVRSSDMAAPVDWTGCTEFTIGSGGETFSYWDHKSDASAMDELRFFNKAMTAAEIQEMINVTNPYVAKYDGETFYMPFEESYTDLLSYANATVVGTTGFAGEGKRGNDSFMGAADSYLTFPIDGLFGTEFSAAFWYKVNSEPNRAGILVVGDDADDRKQGFRLFREGDATSQRIKSNVGTGESDVWNDGGLIDVVAGEWVHIAISVSESKSIIYFNGVEQLSSDLSAGVDWTGCTEVTIGSGGETFSYWDHLSDLSYMDELRLFNKALSQSEIQTIYEDEK